MSVNFAGEAREIHTHIGVMQPMRVMQIVFSFDAEAVGGGISRFAIALSRALPRPEFEPVLCALWDRGTPQEQQTMQELQQAGIQAFAAAAWDEQRPYAAFARASTGLRRALSQQPVDLLHSHSEFSDVAAVLLKAERRTRHILRTVHNGRGLEWPRRPLRRLLLTNLLYPLAFDAEIGVSQHVTATLNRRWLAQRLKRPALCLYNAVDLSRFGGVLPSRAQTRADLGLPRQAYVVGTVGRLEREKGYDVLLQAAAQVMARRPEVYFVIVGDGKEASQLRQQAHDLGIARQVVLTGSRPDVEALLQAMDLFACSSRWEGLSTAVMEAMACGVPLVATDIPGNRELLRAGQSAWMLPPEDPGALAEAILAAHSDPAQCQAYARLARLAVQAFTIQAVADQHAALYRRLCASRA